MREALTELEQCVIGVVWKDGPMTAYEVAAHFAASPSSYWSGSAGAIYPLVKRLTKGGLLRMTQRAWNGARKTVLTTTRAGDASVRAWLRPPLPSSAAAPTYDPIRTRVFFLDALDGDARIDFVNDAEGITAQQIAAAKQRYDEEDSRGEFIASLGTLAVVYELTARQQWLRAVRRRLKKQR